MMDSPTRTNSDAYQIDGNVDADRMFALRHSGEGKEWFRRTGQQIIMSCELGIGLDLWLDELELMVGEIEKWANQRSGSVRSCYGVPLGNKILFFLMPNSESFDFDLADELAKFHVQLLKFNVGNFELIQVPWNEACRFFAREKARHIYGEALGPPDPVEAQ